MASLNIKRIESDIEKYIPIIIQRESEDEILKSITITDCELAHDQSYCKVYFTSLIDMDKKQLEKEVNEASSFIRGKLSQLVQMRNTPILHFTYDTSIEYGTKIEKILEQINKGE